VPNISQGSVATRIRCGGHFSGEWLYCKYSARSHC